MAKSTYLINSGGDMVEVWGYEAVKGTYPIVVGLAGTTQGQNGGNSSAFGYTAIGGGKGSGDPTQSGSNGGSGGAGSYGKSGGSKTGNGYGHAGGVGGKPSGSNRDSGGGGWSYASGAGGAGGSGIAILRYDPIQFINNASLLLNLLPKRSL